MHWWYHLAAVCLQVGLSLGARQGRNVQLLWKPDLWQRPLIVGACESVYKSHEPLALRVWFLGRRKWSDLMFHCHQVARSIALSNRNKTDSFFSRDFFLFFFFFPTLKNMISDYRENGFLKHQDLLSSPSFHYKPHTPNHTRTHTKKRERTNKQTNVVIVLSV